MRDKQNKEMIQHSAISDINLRNKIRQDEIHFGGNKRLKIYGKLQCTSGKKLNRENRVFFVSQEEAIQNGFRPCGHCMWAEYKEWKNRLIYK
jgi:methylphosphotriester-DNA--protein-cysteine methyltransferase